MNKQLALLLTLMLALCGVMLGAQAETAELSDDLYSFQLMMDGEVYQFPMSYADFVARGWVFSGDAEEPLRPDAYMVTDPFIKDGTKVYATAFNLGLNTVPVSQCYLGGVQLDAYYMADSTMEIVFPKGIAYGRATREDIEAAYGSASDVYEGSTYTKLTYEYASYRDIEFQIDSATGLLNQANIRNLVETDEMAQNAGEVSDEIPEVVTRYVAPTELGDDITAFVVDYAGALYRIPAPVSVFIANGWTVMPDDADAVVKGLDTGRITLMKDNQQLKAYIRNYAENATDAANCLVTSVTGNVNTTDVSITLPGGITRGMSQADLEAALADVTYETQDSASFLYYTIAGPYSKSNTVEILVSKEQAAVVGITVNNSPKLTLLYQ